MFLDQIDFAKMFKEHKVATHYKGKNSDDWDEKSKEVAPSMQNSPYVDAFISRMDIKGDEVVLDIGCGPGTLAIPLAKKVKEVIAIDFSAKMLQELELYASKEGITNIKTYHLGWEDDWSVLPKVDIAVASRSMEVADLDAALKKISTQAKKACYVTYMAGGSYVDMEILDFIGKKIITKPDFLYIPILLYKDGYFPNLDYIGTNGSLKSYDKELFVKSLIWSLGSLEDTQKEKAREYFDLHVKAQQKHPKPFTWSFIAWNTQKGEIISSKSLCH